MNPNDPAFPVQAVVLGDSKSKLMLGTGGMPMRLYIATHALQGLLAADWDVPYNEMARQALAAADALIEQEKKH